MDQEEFFDAIKSKKLKESTVTFDCGCQMIYSGVIQEVFGNPCPIHQNDM